MENSNNLAYVTSVAYPAAPEKKSRKKLILVIAGVVVLVGVAAVIAMFLISKNDGGGIPNLRMIFDQSAPIPVKSGRGMYGYMSSDGGDAVIEARFTVAERFYGEYAKVAVLDGAGNKYGVINRSGKMVAEANVNSANADSVEYIVDQDMWKVGTAFFDSKMARVTAEGDVAEYIGYGYLKVKAGAEEYYSRILDRTGAEVYRCADVPCSVMIESDFNSNGEFYAAIQGNDGVSVLVDLRDGSEVMRLNAGKYFIGGGNNIFMVKVARGAVEKQIFVHGGKVKKEFAAGDSISVLGWRDVIRIKAYDNKGVVVKTTYYDVSSDRVLNDPEDSWRGEKVYPSSNFAVFYCEEGYYGLMDGEEEVLPCEYSDIITLPRNVFEYYGGVKKQDLFVLVTDRAKLYNARNKSVVRVFENSDVRFFENSPFYIVGEEKIYNLEMSTGDGLDAAGFSTLDGFGNYFVLDGVTYGTSLKEVRGAF